MIELFRKDIKVGDIVKLLLVSGAERTGKVIEIGDVHI